MRKSLLIAALSACLPMFAVDGEAAAAPTDAAPSSTEPLQPVDTGNAAGGASQDAQSPVVTSAADASATVSAGDLGKVPSASGAASQPVPSTSSETEAGNGQLTPAGASTAAGATEGAGSAVMGEPVLSVATPTPGLSEAPGAGPGGNAPSVDASAVELPNAVASPAASGPASATASSVQIAPLDVVTEADQPAIVHPAHSFADRIHSLAFTLAGSGDSMLSRMGYEITKLVAELKSVL